MNFPIEVEIYKNDEFIGIGMIGVGTDFITNFISLFSNITTFDGSIAPKYGFKFGYSFADLNFGDTIEKTIERFNNKQWGSFKLVLKKTKEQEIFKNILL